jgi:RNA polymerase primary sigma factor
MELREIIRKAVAIGERTGFITFDQLNEICPQKVEPEVIETLLRALSDRDIQVVADDP